MMLLALIDVSKDSKWTDHVKADFTVYGLMFGTLPRILLPYTYNEGKCLYKENNVILILVHTYFCNLNETMEGIIGHIYTS